MKIQRKLVLLSVCAIALGTASAVLAFSAKPHKPTKAEYLRHLNDASYEISRHPKTGYLYARRAFIYSVLQQPEKALADYDTAIKLEPKSSYDYVRRGETFEALGRHQEAVSDLNKAVELKSDHYFAFYCRAVVLCKQKRFKDALSDLNRALPLAGLAWCPQSLLAARQL